MKKLLMESVSTAIHNIRTNKKAYSSGERPKKIMTY